MSNILVIAPHPDDEVLGCGGMLMRSNAESAKVGWLIITKISEEYGWDANQVKERINEIEKVRQTLGIQNRHLFELGFPTTRLDTIPMGEVIKKISDVFQNFQPREILVPHFGDVHSDHRIVFDAVASCTKWFRYPFIKRVLAYETLSETDFSIDPGSFFRPNVYVNISQYIDKKVELLKNYQSEMGEFPFPRSEKAVYSLAQLRGSQSGFQAAEAFQLLYERF